MFLVHIRQHFGGFVRVHVQTVAKCAKHIHRELGTRGHVRGRVRHALSYLIELHARQVDIWHLCVPFLLDLGHLVVYSLHFAFVLYSFRPLLGY